jgi:peptidoglycan/xylan/chitin deacetylase (PgdA/CDA1 family)
MNQTALRQLVVGLVLLPVSAVPFVAYATLTPEGRLVRDKVMVRLSPPQLPSLTPEQQRQAAEIVPAYDGKVMTLVYHGIGSNSDAEGGYVLSAARFAEHLATLRAAGMHVVTAADIAWAFAVGTALPDRAVMISFDDGRSDAMMFADPLLKQAGMKATMFVISGAAARPGLYYAGWDRLRAAARSGRWDIEAHSDASHHLQRVADGRDLPALASLARGESLAAYQARVHADLERNSAAIQAHVGQRPVAFAYPFGAYGAERTNDPGIRAILRDEVASRFVVAFQQDDQATIPLVDPGQPRVGLRRLVVGNWSGIDLLHHIAAAVGRSGAGGASSGPPRVSDPVVKALPPIPFLSELRQRATGPAATAPNPAKAPGPATTSAPTTTSGPSPTPPTPPTTLPPTTTSTLPPTTTTSTGPTTTTTEPAPTTTTTGPTTTTTAGCHGNGRFCRE